MNTIQQSLLTQLTFSFSVAFMKLFIQNETLSFTPTTTGQTRKQAHGRLLGLFIYVASQEAINLGLARLTCWFERDFIDREVHRFAH